jgi:DNA invertase Pin-like site-specific DNA recombinase
MTRVLGVARLSHSTDESTSIERQREDITRRVHADRGTLVTITEDTDISGAVSPFQRPQLGPWLTQPRKTAQWDTLMVSKLDRLSRSVLDFGELLKWCKTNGKNVVSLDGEVNTDTATGWLHVQIVMTFAEFERRRMSERRADASRKIAANAGWHGGHSTEWGYRPVQRGGRWELEPDPEQVTLIQDIAQAIISGESGQAVADRYGVDRNNLLRRLRRPSLYGMVVFKGEIMRGPDGMPLTRDPVIDRETWNKVQARLTKNSAGMGTPRDAAPWFDVIYCGACGHSMYLQRYTNRPNRYYSHKARLKAYDTGEREWCPVSVNGHAVESQIDARVLRIWAGRYAVESVEIPGEDHTEELRQVEEAIADWEAKAMMPGTSAESILRILDGLNARKQAIMDAGVITETVTETVMSDISMTDLWLSQPDDHAKGALLRRMGYRIYVRPDGRGKARIRLVQGDTWPLGLTRDVAAMLDPYEPEYDDNGTIIGRVQTG